MALLAVRHNQLATGGIIEITVYDKLVCDQSGKPVTVRKLLMPDSRAIWRELTHLDPETYDLQNKRKAPIHQPLAPPQHARPRDLEPMFISMVRRLKAIGVLEDPSRDAKAHNRDYCDTVDPTTES